MTIPNNTLMARRKVSNQDNLILEAMTVPNITPIASIDDFLRMKEH